MKKTKEVLARQISLITPENIGKIEKETGKIIKELEKKLRRRKIKADVFIGGSLAKKTLIKKDKYDIDIFVRFDRKYKNISDMLHKIIGKVGKAKRIHGSRDYFQIRKGGKGKILFEIIPVLKIKKPEQAENVTDLSFFHVNYIKNKIKKRKKLAEEIMLAKSFCYAQNCYGAESYIKGFSGYALELLVSHHGSFLNFLKAVRDKDRLVIDPSKFYKNRQEIMLDLNEAKLQSPIVFVDPTFKERNALAALSRETFTRFQKACKGFLKNPNSRFFQQRDIEKEMRNEKEMKKAKAMKKAKKMKRAKAKYELIIIKAKTSRQKGDVAGSKLKRFYELLSGKLLKYFDIKRKEFEYIEDKNIGKSYFILKRKNKIIIQGPPISSIENVRRFKNKHRNYFIKNKRLYASEKSVSFSSFFASFKKKEKAVMKEMGITGLQT